MKNSSARQIEPAHSASRTYWKRALLVAPLALAGVLTFGSALFDGDNPATDKPATDEGTGTPAGPEVIAVPEFGQPAEEERYRTALLQGNQRAIEVLEQALDQARSQASPDTRQIAELGRELERKRTLLASLQTSSP